MKRTLFTLLFLTFCAAPAFAVTFAISPFPPHGEKASAQDLTDMMADMEASGAKGIVVTKTWGELEPEIGGYALGDVTKSMNGNAAKGNTVFLGIQLINTVKRDMPPDLMDKDWDSPQLLARYTVLLSRLAAQVKQAPKYISIGNEADVYFETHPGELDAFLKFYQRASAATQLQFPGAHIGVTVTYEGLVKGRGAIVRKLVDASEVALFTYYPVINLKAQPAEDVGTHLDAIVAEAGGKDVVLQEVGYPSGPGTGASEEKQALFYKVVLSAIRQRPQIAFANLFMLADFSPAVCDKLVSYYNGDKWQAGVKDKFRDFICTLGLKKSDGTAKPAWNVVKDSLN